MARSSTTTTITTNLKGSDEKIPDSPPPAQGEAVTKELDTEEDIVDSAQDDLRREMKPRQLSAPMPFQPSLPRYARKNPH